MAGHASHTSHTSHASGAGAPLLLAAVLLSSACASARPEGPTVRLQSGWVRGVERASGDRAFVSFLGVPYARQPLGELRFRELQPAEPWDDVYEATREGPVCPQRDLFYGRIMRPTNTTLTEGCIYANVHVPLHGLPGLRRARPPPRPLPRPPPRSPPRPADDGEPDERPGLPVLVFVHGGGFEFGSGDTDLHGPEYLVARGVIVVTFNYRLNVFGFLSLNNSYIPGNNGLRDMVTLLRWVQVNARAFGGNPDDVTLAGHSAGSASVHLLTLSEAAAGLFKRAMIMSGTAIPTFYTTAPSYAQFVSQLFLQGLGITTVDPEEVHLQLTQMPLEKIMQVHSYMQDQFGLTVFSPVVESRPVPNFTTILDDDPEALLVMGRGKDVPLIVGFTSAECYGFLPRFEQFDILKRIKENPLIMTPLHLLYRRPQEVSLEIAKIVQDRYFEGEPTMDQYVRYCSEANFVYPALKTALVRAAVGGEPVFLYEFSYESEFSIKKEVDRTNYTGAGHMDDVTYIFRVNSVLGPEKTFRRPRNDVLIQNRMVQFVTNFMKYSEPAAEWPPLTKLDMKYQQIGSPCCRPLDLDRKSLEVLRFFDSLHNRTS